jgi:hypothetical protein
MLNRELYGLSANSAVHASYSKASMWYHGPVAHARLAIITTCSDRYDYESDPV